MRWFANRPAAPSRSAPDAACRLHISGSRTAHPLPRRIVERLRNAFRGPALAEDLDFEVRLRGEQRGNVGQRDRPIYAMAEPARGHPADDLVLVPYRLVAHGVGIAGIDDERDEATKRTVLAIGNGRRAANELRLAQVDKAIQSRLGGRVDRPILARPVAEAFFKPQRIERACAEMRQS